MARHAMTKTPSNALRAYVGVLFLAGVATVAGSWSQGSVRDVALVPVAFWFFLSMASETFWVPTPSGRGMVSMSLAINMASLFVLPLPHAVTIAAASVLFADLLLHRRGPIRANFNASQTAVAVATAGAAMQLAGMPTPPMGSRTILLYPLATLVALPVFFVVNTSLVSGVLAIVSGQSFWRAWRENYGFSYQVVNSGGLFLVGVGVVIGLEVVGYLAGLASLFFLILARDGYRLYLRRRGGLAAAG
jgi:hypothetical protein